MQRQIISESVPKLLYSLNFYRTVVHVNKCYMHTLHTSPHHLYHYKFVNSSNKREANVTMPSRELETVESNITANKNQEMEQKHNYVPLVLDPPFTSVRGEKESQTLLVNYKETHSLNNNQEEENNKRMDSEEIEQEESKMENNQEQYEIKEIVYCCARCHAHLFSSAHYASSSANGIHQSGWPSFLEPVEVNGLESVKVHSLSQKKTVIQQIFSLEPLFWEKEHFTNINNITPENNNNSSRRLESKEKRNDESNSWEKPQKGKNENEENKLHSYETTQIKNSISSRWKIATRNVKPNFVSKHDAMMANLARDIQQHIPRTSLAYRGEVVEKDTIHAMGKSIMRFKTATKREQNIRNPTHRSEKLVHEGCCANCALPVCRVVYHYVYVPVNSEEEEEQEEMENEDDNMEENSVDSSYNNNNKYQLNSETRTEKSDKSKRIKSKNRQTMRKQREMCFVVSPSRVYATLSAEV